MATGVGGNGLYWGVYEGCLSTGDMNIQRRPYNKIVIACCTSHDCMALIHLDVTACLILLDDHGARVVSNWLCQRAPTSPALLSPTVAKAAREMGRAQSRLVLCEEDDKGVEEGGVSCNNV